MFAALILANALSAEAAVPAPQPSPPITVKITPLPEPLAVTLPADAAPPVAIAPARHPTTETLAEPPESALWRGLAAPLIVVIAAGLFAWFLRRKSSPSRLIRVLETASLGPKRSLIVAKIGEETYILGASEAGIHLIGTHTNELPEPEAAPLPEPLQMRPRAAPREQSFEELLEETQEDMALRRKLAAGFAGRVP